MANWIKLFLDVDKGENFRAFEEALRQGRKGRKQRRQAEDTALAQVVRLYMVLGQTSDGKLDMRSTGSRLLAEDVMREEGDDLLLVFDCMAEHGVINREYWVAANVVTTTNAVEQAAARQRLKDRSRNANAAKREKARKGEADEP